MFGPNMLEILGSNQESIDSIMYEMDRDKYQTKLDTILESGDDSREAEVTTLKMMIQLLTNLIEYKEKQKQ